MKIFFSLALSLILAACASQSILPQTEAPEVAQYPICPPEKFRECEIPVEDLFNGNYFRWFKTQAQPFEASQVDERPWVITIIEELMPDPSIPRADGTVTAHRTITSGITEADGIRYRVLPVEFPDPNDPTNPEKNVRVLGVDLLHDIKKNGEIGEYFSERTILKKIDQWVNVMSVAPIITDYHFPTTTTSIPLVERTWQELGKETIMNIFERVEKGDVTALRELNGLPIFFNVTDSRFYR